MDKLFMIIMIIFVVIIIAYLGKMLWDELIQFIQDEKDKFNRIKHQFDNTDDNK